MRLSDELVLVTGAAGFIGSHLVERLLEAGASVVGVDDFDPFYSRLDKVANLAEARTNARFQFEELDCSDPAMLDDVLATAPITSIVHLAAKAGVRPSVADPLGYSHANICATQAVLEFARRREIRRIVFGSSSSVYGDTCGEPIAESMETGRPVSPYAATKRAAELLCHAHAHLHDASVLALRFFTVYGPRQRPDLAIRRFASQMLAQQPIHIHGDGTSSRDYTWIDDIVDGIVAAIERTRGPAAGFDVFNLGGSRPTSLMKLVRLLEHAIGEPAHLEHVPAPPGDVTHTCADTAKAERLLGFRASVPIEEGIPQFVAWLRARERRRVTRAGHAFSVVTSAAEAR